VKSPRIAPRALCCWPGANRLGAAKSNSGWNTDAYRRPSSAGSLSQLIHQGTLRVCFPRRNSTQTIPQSQTQKSAPGVNRGRLMHGAMGSTWGWCSIEAKSLSTACATRGLGW